MNCAALPDTLAEAELFGHERGAFTDAKQARLGLFEAADGGTLLLDEIGALSAATLAKVLTTVEDGIVRRLGSTRKIRVDVRDIGDTASYEIDGAEIVAAIRERNRSAATQAGVRLDFASSFQGPLDSHRGGVLCLIATNLVQNAITATPPGRRVDVSLAAESDVLALTVTDQGTGIPEERREKLFVPGRSTRPGGSGLGLAISQLLARQIGAELNLESSGPAGSRFHLALSLHAEPPGR